MLECLLHDAVSEPAAAWMRDAGRVGTVADPVPCQRVRPATTISVPVDAPGSRWWLARALRPQVVADFGWTTSDR